MHAFTGLLLAALLALLPPAAPAQSGSFQVAQNGHPVGTASFNFAATAQGYDSASIVRVTMQGLDYALSKSESLTPANQLGHVLVSAVVNKSAVTVVAAPDSAQILLSISSNGRRSNISLPAHPGAVFLPDFDPGALETLLTLAVDRNNRGLWAILPKKTGSQIASIEPVQLATYPDMQGTLNGSPITVHHLIATIAGAQTNLFSGPDNQLLQAELPEEGFALVRKGFVLTPSAKPLAAPANQSAAAP